MFQLLVAFTIVLLIAEDAALADDLLFADGFESGDTQAWSSTVPPPQVCDPGIDLEVTSVDQFPDVTIPRGGAFVFDVSLRNNGEDDYVFTWVAPDRLDVYFSVDSILDPAEDSRYRVDLFSVPACSSLTRTLCIGIDPDAVPAGDLYVFIEVDGAGTVVETNEDNNVLLVPSLLEVSPILAVPDFQPVIGAISDSTPFEFEELFFELSWLNNGDSWHQFVLTRTWLDSAADGNETFDFADDIPIQTLSPSPYLCGAASIQTTEVFLLDDSKLGTSTTEWELMVEMDWSQIAPVVESDESNNKDIWPEVITVTPGDPNLIPTGVSITGVDGQCYEPLPLSVMTQNIGTTPSPPTQIDVILSQDNVGFSDPDDLLLFVPRSDATAPGCPEPTMVPGLAPGESHGLDALIGGNGSCLPGASYYVAVVVGPHTMWSAGTLTLETGVDLIADNAAVDVTTLSISNHDTATLEMTVENIGSGTYPGGWCMYVPYSVYLQIGATPDPDSDFRAGGGNTLFPDLGPSELIPADPATLSTTDFFGFSAPLGTWPVYVVHDVDERVCEADRTNNLHQTGISLTIVP